MSHPSLGGFSMASDLANLPNQVLVVPMWRPLASAFSLIHRNGDNPRGKVLATCSILLALLLPVCLVLSLLAKPLVQVALGAKWAPSADYLGYLVLLIIPVFIGPVTSSLLMAQGRTSSTGGSILPRWWSSCRPQWC
jgi:PST family polysaccharide transporter